MQLLDSESPDSGATQEGEKDSPRGGSLSLRLGFSGVGESEKGALLRTIWTHMGGGTLGSAKQQMNESLDISKSHVHTLVCILHTCQVLGTSCAPLVLRRLSSARAVHCGCVCVCVRVNIQRT